MSPPRDRSIGHLRETNHTLKRQIAFKRKSTVLDRTPYGKFTTKRQHVSVQLYTAIILTTFYTLPHKNGANLTTDNGSILFLTCVTSQKLATGA